MVFNFACCLFQDRKLKQTAENAKLMFNGEPTSPSAFEDFEILRQLEAQEASSGGGGGASGSAVAGRCSEVAVRPGRGRSLDGSRGQQHRPIRRI